MLPKLLDMGTSSWGFLRGLGAVLWCCEGSAQLNGHHVGIKKLWPRGWGSKESHPLCLPEQTQRVCLSCPTSNSETPTFCSPSQDGTQYLFRALSSPRSFRAKINTLYGVHRLFSFAVWVYLLIDLSSLILALEKLRSQVLRCFGGFVQVRKLRDMVSGCGSTASPILIWGSLPTLYYISWAEDLPPGASWFSQPLGLDGCFSSFKEGVNDLRCCSNAHSVWFCCFERGPENLHFRQAPRWGWCCQGL